MAATLTALETENNRTPTLKPTQEPTNSSTPTEIPSPTASPTSVPPPDGISLNCDGTYQRVRVVDAGEPGQSVVVDQWSASGWRRQWQFDGGDPIIRQISERADTYHFDGCQQLIAVPLLYMGSGAVLELHIFEWAEQGAVEVYSNNGTHGDWQLIDDRLRFERSLYLYDEPNCCPCNREIVEHRWNGDAFVEVEAEIRPTYTGTPPSICQP